MITSNRTKRVLLNEVTVFGFSLFQVCQETFIRLPNFCECGDRFDVQYAFSFKKVSLVTIWDHPNSKYSKFLENLTSLSPVSK